MTDYIKREDAIKRIEKQAKQLEPPINLDLSNVRSGILTAKWLIEDIPSADVVEVVMCKDCKHRKLNDIGYFCNYHGCEMLDADFCSYGERAEE